MSSSPRDKIVEKSRRVVRGYAAARDDWNPASSLSSLLRQMQREYEGRFLYELIQNAYDAQPVNAEGNIVVLLDLEEGDHGVLYVANGGTPFTDHNFEAICDLARSDKAPDVSIGNKGVGFKSVLQVCQWPEIYSAEEPGQHRFEGYCFTFAHPEMYVELAGGDTELAAHMRKDLSPYFLPAPIDHQPPHVLEFASRGLATVVRLPIKSTSAREIVVERVTRLAEEDVPVHLFLERLRTIEITRLDAESAAQTRMLSRKAIPVGAPAPGSGQRFEHVDLGEQGRWFITSRCMPAEAMREAIAESIAEGQLDESWATWSHDAWVSVATRTDGLDIRPRLYTFLPMEREASAPLHGHIHAPFSTRLARTSVSENVLLNARLLDCAASASTAAILAFRDSDDVLPETALIDLLAWDEHHHRRVTQSFADADIEMEHLEVIPIEPLPGRRRAALSSTYTWRYADLALLNQRRLARDAGAELVSAIITGRRLERLEEYCRTFFQVGFKAEGRLRADWVEKVARAIHARRSRPRTWDSFYDDLAKIFEHDASALRGRTILLGDDGQLHSSPPDDDGQDHPLVFFPPARERTDEDDEVEADVDLKPPASLRRALILMSEELRWTRQDGPLRRRTPARRFLEDSKLVRRFRTVDLLEHIGRALARSNRVDLARDALRFTFSLSMATRSVRQRDLQAVGLRVPTRGGWRRADHAFFSPGWETPLAGLLSELINRASPSGEIAAIADLLLNEPRGWPCPVDDRDGWRAFLTQLGVRDGLWPRPVAHGRDASDGEYLTPSYTARRFSLTAADTERWVQAVTASTGWKPCHPYTPYRPRDDISIIPGQAEYEAFDHRARVLFGYLVAAGLEHWPTGALEITWHRYRHPAQPDERQWPSPIAAFLRETAWLPVTVPGHQREEAFAAPRDAWYFADSRGEELPYFSPLLTGHLRRRLSADTKALARLKQAGLADWGDPDDSPHLLRHLASLVEQDALSHTGAFAFSRAYEEAWSRAAGLPLEQFAGAAGDLPVVVTRAGQLATQRPSDTAEPHLFLLGQGSSLASRALEVSDLPVIDISSKDEARVRPLLKALFKDRLLTVDDLKFEVITDTGRFTPDGSGELLIDGDRRWLETLIALILETRRSGPGQLGPSQRTEVAERLRRVRRVETSTISVRIGQFPINLPERQSQVVPLDDLQHPTLVVVPHHNPRSDLEDLIAISRPLCELLGITYCEDPLQLALERLHGERCVSPEDDDFARVLEISPDRIAEIRSHLGRSLGKALHLLVPLVAYHAGIPQALALRDARSRIENGDDIRAVLSAVAPSLPALDLALAASQKADTLSGFRDMLGLDYERFNIALRSLEPEYEPIHNQQGHLQAMEHYVQVNRSGLLLDLRCRFAAAFQPAHRWTHMSTRGNSPSCLIRPGWTCTTFPQMT